MEFTVSAQNNDKDKQEPLDTKRQRGIRRTVALTLLAVALVIGVMVYNVTRTPTIDREALREQGAVLLEQPRRFTEFELVDHRGEVFIGDNFNDKWPFSFFVFSH